MSELANTIRLQIRTRCDGGWAWAGAAAVLLSLAGARPAQAQYIETYLPAGVPGANTAEGVTVLSRARPLYDNPGIRSGNFIIRPTLSEGFGYDSDPNGTNLGKSSTYLVTSPALSINSDWSRNALGLTITAQNYHYFDLPRQDYTNWTASVGGAYTIGRSALTLTYSHLSLNQNATTVGALQSDTPVPFTVDDVHSDYTFDFGRISLTPMIDVRNFNFSNAAILGRTVSQAYRNRVVLTGGGTARYNLSNEGSIVVVLQGVDSSFTSQTAGQPSNDSTSVIALGGLDYQASGPVRYRLLAGVEQRSFAASQYKSHTAPIVEGQAVWTPTGLTTVTGSVARAIESTSSEGSNGFVYTLGRVVVDHELYRNILLQGRTAVELAQYLQGGGSQTSYAVGAGVTWLLNRNVRLSLDYNFFDRSASQVTTFNGVPNVTSINTAPSSRNVALLALHLGL